MTGKLNLITELYDTMLHDISSERRNWHDFLRFTSVHYRYPFDQQLLLYGQRPTATAVMSMEDWNMRYGRWVARGSKAIAVFDENFSSKRQLRFLFDIADTVETNQTRPIPRFEVLPAERSVIVDALEASTGELSDQDTFEKAMLSLVQNVVQEHMPQIMRDVLVSLEDSFLESCTDEEIEDFFSSTITESVAYVEFCVFQKAKELSHYNQIDSAYVLY